MAGAVVGVGGHRRKDSLCYYPSGRNALRPAFDADAGRLSVAGEPVI